MTYRQLVDWLLQGDVAIQYQTWRDLLGKDRPDLQSRIPKEGWGAQFLSRQRPDGHWGKGFYQPKWTSTHYTLLDLKQLGLPPDWISVEPVLEDILENAKSKDGGIDPHRSLNASDVCVNGMFLNYACYFGVQSSALESVVDFVISQKMADGGFNCRSNRSGAVHSSLHTTLSVMEGILEYERQGYSYRLAELKSAKQDGLAFILLHQLYKSDRTGKIIKKDFLKMAFPGRWKYDILRALDHFQAASIPFDHQMQDALDYLWYKRTTSNQWKLQAYHVGQLHFKMEAAGKVSRWNTLRMLRVLKQYRIALPELSTVFPGLGHPYPTTSL